MKEPQDSKVEPGEEVTFSCLPPKGEPPPHIKWRKDGEELEHSLGYDGDGDGSLVVIGVEKEDSGKYVCVAYNEAGERESRAASLIVKGG